MSEALVPRNAPETNEAGEVIDSRPYYCPGCGARYETSGHCTGIDPAAGHPAIALEKAKGESDDKGSVHAGAERRSGADRRVKGGVFSGAERRSGADRRVIKQSDWPSAPPTKGGVFSGAERRSGVADRRVKSKQSDWPSGPPIA